MLVIVAIIDVIQDELVWIHTVSRIVFVVDHVVDNVNYDEMNVDDVKVVIDNNHDFEAGDVYNHDLRHPSNFLM